MARYKAYVISAVLCSLVVLGQGDLQDKGQVKIIPVDTANPTPPSIAASTIPPTPSTIPPTPSTIPPTPPTSPPTTTAPTTTPSTTTSTEPTTTKKTTTTTTTTTTTPAPPPTPSPAPTPAPSPTPPPAPTQGTWVFEEKNVTCIVVQFAAQLNVTYNRNSSIAHLLLNVPSNATVGNGSCSTNGSQWLELQWPAPNATLNRLRMVFAKNDSTQNYALKNLTLTLSAQMFPNGSMPESVVELSHGPEWQTPLATSYRCGPPTGLNMTDDRGSVVASLTVSQLQEQAFRTAHGTTFSAARECGSGDVPDAVPIAVGCALGGLVVVVLVAYLAARRRSAARGYLSM